MRTGTAPAIRRAVSAAGAILAAGVLAGCGAAGPTVPEWTDDACTAVESFVQTAVAAPRPGPTPAEQVQAVGDYLDGATAALDRTLGDLDRLGPAPVDDGETVADDLAGGLGEIRSAFAAARSGVDAIDPADPVAVERDLPRALDPVSRLGSTTGPISVLTGHPELREAFRESAACGELSHLADPSASTSTPDGAGSVAPDGSAGEGGGG